MKTQSRLRTIILLLVVGILLLPAGGLAAQARNILLMIGDGMGPSHVGAAWLYSNRTLGKELRMVEVMKGGRTAYVVNDTADAIVTESAAAATQIACGVRVPARAVGMGPDGKTPCQTVLELAKAKGMATGLVTTSGITDATPAAFAAHVPHRSDEASVAAQELQLGVDVLLGGRKQFFLPEAQGGKRKDGRMIEGGRIDHAAHRNDAAGTIRDTLAFDDAVGVALEFQRRNPDTLLIVTADHETGGMAVIGHSKDSKEYVGIDLSAIQKAQASMEFIVDELGKSPTPEKVREAVKRHLAIEITEDEAKVVADDTIRKLDPKNYSYATLHSLAFVLRPYLRVGWASQTHTASPLFAFGAGPGSEELVGFRHNTELFRIMKAALEAGR